MDTSPIPLIKAVLPKVPLMGKTALTHTFGLSEQSKHWDLRTTLIVNILRSFITDGPAHPVSKVQHMSLKDPGIKGKIWVSKVTMPKPQEDDIRQALFKAIEGLKEPGQPEGGFTLPELLPVEAEWTGHRAGATNNSTELKIPEKQKYTEMMREVYSPTTILYFHGGAYYLMDPASHRPTCKKLAKLTKGRCFNVRYRLAPQNPFPSALLDALVSYLSLLYPPEGSFHEAVKPEHIVFAGDSAGGNLSLVLVQTILEFRRQGLKVRWNGEERDVPMPAGVATCSAWTDVTHSSPSCEDNALFDYLPSVSVTGDAGMEYPPCDIWPTNPPRKNLYADDGLLCHPLVSPLVAKSWEGSCPLYIQTGQELLTDENKHIVHKAALQSVTVVYEEYQAMPHCFAMVLEQLPGSYTFFSHWSTFISDIVNKKESVTTKGTHYAAKTLKATKVDVKTLSVSSDEEVAARMRERARKMTAKQPGTMSKL
ncbi:alpha/beta hydrolase fold-domain-containing protein [Halenospora varia]|nr:alpha/beta hydrolase fold-domain-containing protein [Halenospora varia]